MNNINDFIKTLSIKDKKTLSQKGLKLVEEVGELARVILPYDSAHGTNHRFIDREAILEEVVDVYLTNISIAHSLGFTDEEFNDMLAKKSEKWSKLQANEEKAEFPLPFEIHVTVDFDELFTNIWSEKIQSKGVIKYPIEDRKAERQEWIDKLLDKFKDVCSKIGVKPIVIDLEINDGSIIKDIMTSSKHFGDNRSAYEESERICSELRKYGYKVLRNKIESVPWHPAAPVISNGKEIPNGCYFEAHIGVTIYPGQKNELNDFVKSTLTDGHLIELSGTAKLSQNFFKKSKDGSKFVNMLTYRSNMCGSPKFKLEVEGIKHLLQEEGFEFEKVEVEYAVYDTNVTHDAKWILGYEVA
jgi:NTP pyrophosphatase (non-canonical NTP hydrolase)